MPQAIPAFFAAIGNALLGAAISAGISYSTAFFIISVGAKLAGLALLGAIANKLIDIPDLDDTARSNLITIRGTLEHQHILYGETLITGPLWYVNTAGTHNQSLYHAIVLAGHQIEDITDVWLDDEIIPNAAIDWAGDGSVDSGWLRGDVGEQTTAYFDKFLGLDDQSASADLVAAFSEISSQHQGRNIAWFLVRLDFFDGQTDVWSGGAPRNYKALAKGKLVYNPNSDSSQAWGTGPHRVNSEATWEYSDNPALCWADYMIDASLGFGEDSARIRYNYVASVAAICSASVATPNSATTERFRCNGRLNTGHTHQQNLESILSSGNMTMALVQGQWVLRGWEYETPALAFDDDDLRGDIQIALSSAEEKRYNTVRPYFIDRDRRYQAQQAPSVTASEYVARDNAEVLHKDTQLPMTTDVYMAQRLAFGLLEQSDLQREVIYPSNFKTLAVEIGGTIMLSNAKMGWVNDTFRVTNYKINDLKGIDLVLQEDNSGAYTDVATGEYTVSSQGVYTKNSPGVPAPTSFSVNNVPEGIRLNWTPAAARLQDGTEIWRNSVNTFDSVFAEMIDLSRVSQFLDTPKQSVLYYYWLRSRNFVGDVSSPTPHQYSGEVGVWAGDHIGVNHDPSFEQTKRGFGDASFWSTTGSSFTSGKGRTSFEVTSDDLGSGGSHILEIDQITDPGSNGTFAKTLFNNKLVPIIHGSGLAVNVRYRVTSYSNVESTFIEFETVGKKSLHVPGAGTGLWASQLAIPNSIDWTIYSDFLNVATFSNTASYSFMGTKIEHWTFQGTSVVNTTHLHIDIDWALWRWVNP